MEQTGGLPGALWVRMRGVNPCLGSHLPNFPQMLSPTYKQRNEDFRKLFSKLPEAERLIVGESRRPPCPGRRPWAPSSALPTLPAWVLARPAV